MRALVVNCSAPHYNLGAAKLADWLAAEGHEVQRSEGDPGLFVAGFDLVALSVIFSWHAPIARRVALAAKASSEVWCGGPGMFTLGNWWQRETGLQATLGLDQRFDRQRGNYTMTFASRGCPVGCYFCIVPKLEGTDFTLDWGFEPAPVLCDNNLSALPDAFQQHIIDRYASSGVALKDANSGFEPATFTKDTYERWKPTMHGPWRFAYDTTDEGAEVATMMQILHDEPPYRKRVYVLIGNEPIAACYQRARRVIDWGGQPFCQPMLPLNALDKHAFKLAHDWTPRRLVDFARYFNRYLWRYMTPADYRPRPHGVPSDWHLAL